MVARTQGHGVGGHGPMGRPLPTGRFGSMAARASAAVLAIAAGLALSAPAQAQTTLVSNASETRSGATNSPRASSFTTGSNAGGYTITELQLWLGATDLATADLSVSLLEDDSGEPGTLVADFTEPTTRTGDALNTFTAPAGTTVSVAANSTYWVTVSDGVTDPVNVGHTQGDGETGAAGWSIGDGALYQTGGTGDWSSSTHMLSMVVKGTIVLPAPTLVSNINQTVSTGGDRVVGTSGTAKFTQAQPFTTGDNEGGYTLAEVVVKVASGASATDVPRVSIYTESSDEPGTSLYTLANPTTFGNGNRTFEAPANATLAKQTTYFVVVEETVDSWLLSSTSANAEDDAESGWSIGDDHAWRNADDGDWGTNTRSLLVTINGTITLPPATVTIEAEHDSIGGGLEDLDFTLTRTGATTAELDATVTITQDESWLGAADLSHEVTFAANSATATLTIGWSKFSYAPTSTGTLTATVSGTGITGGSDEVEVISISEPPITFSYDKASYTFAEDATNDSVYVVATLNAAYPRLPSIRTITASFSTRKGTAESPEDYAAISWMGALSQSEYARAADTDPWVARYAVPDFEIRDDEVYDEGSETFTMIIEHSPGFNFGRVQFAHPDGTTCGPCSPTPAYTVTITDNDNIPPVLSLSADPTAIDEEDDTGTMDILENVSIVTVETTNDTTFARDTTLTLTIGGTATQGTHYSVLPEDADLVATGYQVVMPHDADSVEVTVTAVANTTADGNQTVTVAGELGGTSIGSATITIRDNEAIGTTVPGAPTSLTATASGTGTINLAWTAPTDNGGLSITGYKIEVSSDGGSNWTELVATNTATTYSHTGLSAGTTRHYRVSAINANGTGNASATANATTANVPGAPTSLTATADGATAIDLAWDAPSSDGGSAITGYKIEVSSDGGSTWTDLVANTGSTSTTYDHTGLSAGSTRHYRVSAINANGTGTASATANATTPAGALVSNTGQTSSTTAGILGTSGSLKYSRALGFTTGDNAGGYTLSSVQALVARDNATSSLRVSIYGADASDKPGSSLYTLTNPSSIGTTRILLTFTAPANATLAKETTYFVVLEAPTGSGKFTNTASNAEDAGKASGWEISNRSHSRGSDAGSWSESLTSAIPKIAVIGTTNINTTTVPGAPTDLTATADGATAIDLAWNAPSDDGGSAITGYKIEVSPDGTTWTDLEDDTDGTGTTYEHTGLTAGTTRHYRVSAINANGTGTASSTANATTATTVPGAPTSLTATADGSTEIDLAWTAPSSDGGSSITGYKIEVSSDGGTSWTDLEDDTNSTGTTYSHTGLTAGTTRHYRVSAINANGTGTASNVANATTDAATTPAPVIVTDGVQVTSTPAAGDTYRLNEIIEITVTFDNAVTVTTSGGTPRIQFRLDGALNRWAEYSSGSGGTALSFTYTVQSGDKDDNGIWLEENFLQLRGGTIRAAADNTVNATLTYAEPGLQSNHKVNGSTVPSAPRNLTATAGGASFIGLAWLAPADNGGSAITGYKIEVSPNGTTWTDLVANTGGTGTTYSHTGLSDGTTRHYRVSAINANGTGPASGTASATTTTAATTVPGAPTGLSATASGTARINLSWTTPSDNGGSPITGYRIEVSSDGGSSWTDRVANTNSTGTTYAHTGLSAGTTRHYRVSAINANGTGAASSTASATTNATTTAPRAPTNLAATADGVSTINLAWSAPTDDGGSPITGYRIEVSQSSVSGWTDLVGNTNSTRTSYSHTGLPSRAQRYYRVSAINAIGTGNASGTASARTGDARKVRNVQVDVVVDPNVPPEVQKALGPNKIMALRVDWDLPDIPIGQVRGWLVQWGKVKNCNESPPNTWDGPNLWFPDEAPPMYYRPAGSAPARYFRVAVAFTGGMENGPWSDPACGDISAASADAADGDDAQEEALARIADGLTPDEAAGALFGDVRLSEARLAALDLLGNGNGRYDLGDLLAWIDRCKRGEARCGTTLTDSSPPSAAGLAAAAATRRPRRRTGRRGSGRRGRTPLRTARRRRGRFAGYALAALLAAATTLSCADGPAGPAAYVPDPGFLTVEWSGPVAASRDVGVLLELEGPGIETVQAPGYELYESGAPGPRRIVLAGPLEEGPLAQFRVPDRNRSALYRVRVIEVTGEDYQLRNPAEYRAVILTN